MPVAPVFPHEASARADVEKRPGRQNTGFAEALHVANQRVVDATCHVSGENSTEGAFGDTHCVLADG